MGIRIPWDKDEVAILLYYSEKVLNHELPRSEAVITVSKLLRKKAIKQGLIIDSMFRNENGISMQMNIMTALIENKPYGLHKASKLFAEIVNIYKSDNAVFTEILNNAIEGGNMITENKLTKIEFNKIANISYTKPVSMSFFNVNYNDFSNWSQLYIKVLGVLYSKFHDVILSLYGKNINGNGRIEIYDDSNVMVAPKEFAPNLFVETNISATDIIKKIHYLIDLCGIDYDSLIIYYQKKESKNPDLKNEENYKEMSDSNMKTLIDENALNSVSSIIDILKTDYENGFKFDATSIRLLKNKSGCYIDNNIIDHLKKILFKRKDEVYFLIDAIADDNTRNELISCSDNWLDSFGFFEVQVLADRYLSFLNQNIIIDFNDFIDFYGFIHNRKTRCVDWYRTKIVRISDNMNNLANRLITELTKVINDDFFGTINEFELRERLPSLSIDLLDKLIKDFSDEIVRTSINDIICYQTIDALGLPNDFSDRINETLELLDSIDLNPTIEVLHTALSINLSRNFKKEYNIPDDKTFKKIIEKHYNLSPTRSWIKGSFLEEQNNNV